MRLTPLAHIAPVREISTVFGTLLGIIVLRGGKAGGESLRPYSSRWVSSPLPHGVATAIAASNPVHILHNVSSMLKVQIGLTEEDLSMAKRVIILGIDGAGRFVQKRMHRIFTPSCKQEPTRTMRRPYFPASVLNVGARCYMA